MRKVLVAILICLSTMAYSAEVATNSEIELVSSSSFGGSTFEVYNVWWSVENQDVNDNDYILFPITGRLHQVEIYDDVLIPSVNLYDMEIFNIVAIDKPKQYSSGEIISIASTDIATGDLLNLDMTPRNGVPKILLLANDALGSTDYGFAIKIDNAGVGEREGRLSLIVERGYTFPIAATAPISATSELRLDPPVTANCTGAQILPADTGSTKIASISLLESLYVDGESGITTKVYLDISHNVSNLTSITIHLGEASETSLANPLVTITQVGTASRYRYVVPEEELRGILADVPYVEVINLGPTAAKVDDVAETFITAGTLITGDRVKVTATVMANLGGFLAAGTYYYINLNAGEISFHLTRAHAIAGTNKIDITDATADGEVLTITQAWASGLFAVFHSSIFPNGEIRGQFIEP